MEPYIFYGVVLPERARLDLTLPTASLRHHELNRSANVTVNIYLNQLVVWVETTDEWQIFDLRNVVRTFIQNYLSIVGYLRGYAYDLEITRALHRGRGIDVVFGIEIPILEHRQKNIDLQTAFMNTFNKVHGKFGIYLNRCLKDLTSAIKDADDTAFYCYRAIESLQNHCAEVNGLTSSSALERWRNFRSFAACDEAAIRWIKNKADPLRHGNSVNLTDEERQKVFLLTWDIVENYLKMLG